MLNKSVFRKATAIAVVLALVLATLPTVTVFAAPESNKQLETRWDNAVKAFNKQEAAHHSAHKIAENYLATNKNLKASEKAEMERYLRTCNTALYSAKAIVNTHAGFSAAGKVTDRVQAKQSIKLLTQYVQQHAAALKHIRTTAAR
jgi:hypothetical protein